MDELTIDGKTYISSKKAAKVSGYAKDYVGQLCREGRVEAKLVGRSWYVYEPSLSEHRFNDERSKVKKTHEAVEEQKNAASVEKTPIHEVWEAPSYTSESFEVIPAIQQNNVKTAEVSNTQSPKTVTEMQTAWQEWFSGRSTEEAVRQETYEDEPKPVHIDRISTEKKEEPVQKPFRTQEVPIERYEYRREPVVVQEVETRPIDVPRPTQGERAEVFHAPIKNKRRAHTQRRDRNPLVLNAVFVTIILFAVSIMLISTGLIEELHLGTITKSPIIEYFQGLQVVEK